MKLIRQECTCAMKRFLAFIIVLVIIICFFGCQDNSNLISTTIKTNEVNNDLYVHFIDVGQADSTLIICGDKAILIDEETKQTAI